MSGNTGGQNLFQAPTRETVSMALLAKIQSASLATSPPMFTTVTRILQLWNQVPQDQQPWCCVTMRLESHIHEGRGIPRKLVQEGRLFIYFPANDQTIPGDTQINNLLDFLEQNVFYPDSPRERVYTIGGLVNRCWIEGQVIRDPGDLNNQGLLIVPFKVLFP